MKSAPANSIVLTLTIAAFIACSDEANPSSMADTIVPTGEDLPYKSATDPDRSGHLPEDSVFETGTVLKGGSCQFNSDCVTGFCCFSGDVFTEASLGFCFDSCPPFTECAPFSMGSTPDRMLCQPVYADCRPCDVAPTSCHQDFFCVPFGTHRYCIRTCYPTNPQRPFNVSWPRLETVLGPI